ncbi:MAG: TIGR00645 family protein [Rhodocyclaceae bacterium]|nr:TIGR00645 family protein [Rhodocyclaceae bacterium]
MLRFINFLEATIFWSRWLQAPLYLGLIVAQGVYAYKFIKTLLQLVTGVATMTSDQIMLIVLGLIDVVMIANLLIMVIIGGYETFVSRLNLDAHRDQPEWLNHINAGVLKIKLATALISISSIHLLASFMNVENVPEKTLMWQVIIHATLLISALLLAITDKVMNQSVQIEAGH